MKFDFDSQFIIDLLAKASRCTVIESEGIYQIVPRRQFAQDVKINADLENIKQIIENIKAKEIYDETTLFDDFSSEVVVREESSLPFPRFREDKLEINDVEGEIIYELSPCSDEYLVWLLTKISQESSFRDYGLGMIITPNRVRKFFEETAPRLSIFDFVRFTSSQIITLKIRSNNKINIKRFSQLIYAFLFQLGYNFDLAFVPHRSIEDMSRRGRITRMRRSSGVEEIDPPRRLYNDDLIHHYLLAVSTDNPVVEFLSYYHVLEHFFEEVFNDELLETVKIHITHPGFSYKRKKDIGQLVNVIKKSLQIRSETITFSESEALRLCLAKFINIPELVAKLNEYDEDLINYYCTNSVPFSGGVIVNLESADIGQILQHLTKRIYSTRNALVHSKENELKKYKPFVDERALLKEVPLMRFISEMVILSESTVL